MNQPEMRVQNLNSMIEWKNAIHEIHHNNTHHESISTIHFNLRGKYCGRYAPLYLPAN